MNSKKKELKMRTIESLPDEKIYEELETDLEKLEISPDLRDFLRKYLGGKMNTKA